MRAVICGANGAMGQLLCGLLGEEVAGRVSIDGENFERVDSESLIDLLDAKLRKEQP